MSRPSSRGYGAKVSVGGTGVQPGRNIGTAQRLTTGQRRQVNYGGIGMEHDVQVSNRPVTGKFGGMSGMRVKTAGPQRQVQDNTYWLGILRAKCDEIELRRTNTSKVLNNIVRIAQCTRHSNASTSPTSKKCAVWKATWQTII